ncbi:MAG: hypothetical protein ABSG13_31075 [Bryobacteraceae bacterium]|jgi:hypothetical protein
MQPRRIDVLAGWQIAPVCKALILMALVLSVVTRVLALGLVAAVRPVLDAPALRGPLGGVAGGSGISGRTGTRVAGHIVAANHRTRARDDARLGLAWAGAVVVDLLAERWRVRLDPRVHGVSYSVLPLGRQDLQALAVPWIVLSAGNCAAAGIERNTIAAAASIEPASLLLTWNSSHSSLYVGLWPEEGTGRLGHCDINLVQSTTRVHSRETRPTGPYRYCLFSPA